MTDFQFRLWAYLLTYVDDFGRGDARPEIIKGRCFPLRTRVTLTDIDNALRALAGIGCVQLYEVDAKPYLYFPKWELHQQIRNKKSRYPAPDDSISIDINCNQLPAIVPVIQSESNPNPNTNPNPNPNTNPKGADAFAEFAEGDGVLLEALRNFEQMRKSIKSPLTDRAKALLLTKLQTFPYQQWVEILNQSILNNWKSIYPLDSPKKKGTYTLSNGTETSNQFLAMLEEETHGQK